MAEEYTQEQDRTEKKPRRGWLWLGLSLLAGAGIGSVYAWKKASNRFQPQTKGLLTLPGLLDKVVVERDRWGVPHIFAENEADLFRAQGFIQAQDRLWQLELNRRIGTGTLSAVIGKRGLDLDKFTHRVGIARAANQDLLSLDESSAAILEAFSAGVNAFIDLNKLPVEFSILKYRPEPWRPLDTLAWVKTFAWSLSGNYDTEFTRALMLSKLGSRLAAKFEPFYPKGHPLIAPEGADYEGITEEMLAVYQHELLAPLLTGGGGSNNWVISGSRTESGKPLLANDPHLPLQMPSLWYEMHLSCPSLEAVGACLPGSPCVAIGRNRNIAWGATAAMTDLQDLFIEQFNPENPKQYLRDGQWEDAEVINIDFAVKGQENYREELLVTAHGPVIADLPHSVKSPDRNYKIALQWTGYRPSNLLGSFLALNRASDWDEFREAFRNWTAPGFNMIYADRAGNIGYQLIAPAPIRKTGGGLLPLPGWLSDNDWQGYIPYDELPTIYNPPSGIIITANNRIANNEYPYYLSSDYANGYRAARLQELFNSKQKFSLEDCRIFQNDCTTLPGRHWAKLFVEKVNPEDLSPLAKEAFKYVKGWNGEAKITSVAQSLYQTTLQKLYNHVFGGLLGDDVHYYLGKSLLGVITRINSFVGRSSPFILDMIEKDDRSVIDELPSPQSWSWILQYCFEQAVADLSRRFGSNVKSWQWGKLHRANFEHPLGTVKALKPLFNRGSYPIAGDGDTPAQMAFPALGNAQTGFNVTGWAVSYRQIVDLSNMENSYMCHTTGQSGSPFSPHYDDMIKLWLKGEMHPMISERRNIDRHSEARLILESDQPKRPQKPLPPPKKETFIIKGFSTRRDD